MMEPCLALWLLPGAKQGSCPVASQGAIIVFAIHQSCEVQLDITIVVFVS